MTEEPPQPLDPAGAPDPERPTPTPPPRSDSSSFAARIRRRGWIARFNALLDLGQRPQRPRPALPSMPPIAPVAPAAMPPPDETPQFAAPVEEITPLASAETPAPAEAALQQLGLDADLAAPEPSMATDDGDDAVDDGTIIGTFTDAVRTAEPEHVVEVVEVDAPVLARPEQPAPRATPQQVTVVTWLSQFSWLAWPATPAYWNGYLAVLTVLGTLTFLMFVLAEPSPRWILLVGAGAVVAGLDGALRATWRVAFAEGDEGLPTTPYLVLPALYMFAAPLLIEHNVRGHLAIVAALAAGAGLGAIATAEVLSVRTRSPLHPYARIVNTAATYFTAFSLLSMTQVLDLGLLPAVVATWFIATMLAIEILREGEVDQLETAVFASIVGLVVAQACWLLFFLPLGGYPAGLALVLVLYLATGILHSYVLRQLNTTTAAEYGLVTTIGLALLAAARAAGIA